MSVTTQIFAEDAYASTCDATVLAINELGGIILDQTVFYATSGGQPGDSGYLERANGEQIAIATTVYEKGGKETIVHVPEANQPQVEVGEKLIAHIDWDPPAQIIAHAYRLSHPVRRLPQSHYGRCRWRKRKPYRF